MRKKFASGFLFLHLQKIASLQSDFEDTGPLAEQERKSEIVTRTFQKRPRHTTARNRGHCEFSVSAKPHISLQSPEWRRQEKYSQRRRISEEICKCFTFCSDSHLPNSCRKWWCVNKNAAVCEYCTVYTCIAAGRPGLLQEYFDLLSGGYFTEYSRQFAQYVQQYSDLLEGCYFRGYSPQFLQLKYFGFGTVKQLREYCDLLSGT